MVLIFWQGIISIHQKTFLEALARQESESKVMLVAEHAISPYRKNMGWEVPAIENVEIITGPTRKQVAHIFSTYKDAVHISGGVRIGNLMKMAFEECVNHQGRMGSLSEPYGRSGMKGKLRHIKYLYTSKRYYKHIDFFLAVGKEGVRTYRDLKFNPDRIFPWAYFVSVKNTDAQPAQDGIRKIIYAGRLEEGKGIFRFVTELAASKKANYQLDIYGDGPDKQAIEKCITENEIQGKVTIYPFLKYDEMVSKYAHYDWVVLPSTKKDGWGVIVSEGLLNGLKAICSSICGVSWAIRANFNGLVFDWNKEGDCRNAIEQVLHNDHFESREVIKKWAQDSVSAEAGADYYLKIIDFVYSGGEKPGIPWEHQ